MQQWTDCHGLCRRPRALAEVQVENHRPPEALRQSMARPSLPSPDTFPVTSTPILPRAAEKIDRMCTPVDASSSTPLRHL